MATPSQAQTSLINNAPATTMTTEAVNAAPGPLCNICLEAPSSRDPTLITLSCAHAVCADCLTTIFTSAVEHERSFPPKCCAPIPLTPDIAAVLHHTLVNLYQHIEPFYALPPKLRTYCANATCAQPMYLDLLFREDGVGSCGRCDEYTCRGCKNGVDPAIPHRCQGLEEDVQALEAAIKAGFKRCPKCGVMIELADACNHIQCDWCQHQFCFVCLRQWKSWKSDAEHNCPMYLQPDADAEGYIAGFHKDTGFDRDGYDREGWNEQGTNRAVESKSSSSSSGFGATVAAMAEPQWADRRRRGITGTSRRRDLDWMQGMTDEELEEMHTAMAIAAVENGGEVPEWYTHAQQAMGFDDESTDEDDQPLMAGPGPGAGMGQDNGWGGMGQDNVWGGLVQDNEWGHGAGRRLGRVEEGDDEDEEDEDEASEDDENEEDEIEDEDEPDGDDDEDEDEVEVLEIEGDARAVVVDVVDANVTNGEEDTDEDEGPGDGAAPTYSAGAWDEPSGNAHW